MSAKKTTIAEFFREVNQERKNVKWPTAKETRVTSLMVFVMCAIMAIFFLGVDQLLNWGIQQILSIGA